jgi:hypothetical protein
MHQGGTGHAGPDDEDAEELPRSDYSPIPSLVFGRHLCDPVVWVLARA